jgi:Zn-dependent protease
VQIELNSGLLGDFEFLAFLVFLSGNIFQQANTAWDCEDDLFGRQLTLLNIFGIDIKIDVSWLFLAVLISWSLATGYFPAMYVGLEGATYWRMGILGMVGLALSIILHELAHSLVAMSYGLRIRAITLFIFGGIAELEAEPKSAKSEFLIAIAGPIMSGILALLSYGLATSLEAAGFPLSLYGVCAYLAMLNSVLAIFNMVPGFPLDGGRVLRAVLWHLNGDLIRATRTASKVGEFFGFALIAIGFINILTGNFVPGLWYGLIGFFLRNSARATYSHVIADKTLSGEVIGKYVTGRPVTVAQDMTVQQLVDFYFYQHHHDMFPVLSDSQLKGCVHMRQVQDVPRETWNRVRVADLLQPATDDNVVDANTSAMEVLTAMQRTGNARMMVVAHGQLTGIVSLKDLLTMLELKLQQTGV